VTSTTSDVSIFVGASLDTGLAKLLMIDCSIEQSRQIHQYNTPQTEDNKKTQKLVRGKKKVRGFGGPSKKNNVWTNLPTFQDCCDCPAKAIISLHDKRFAGLYVTRVETASD
jgi:hypothetical protein